MTTSDALGLSPAQPAQSDIPNLSDDLLRGLMAQTLQGQAPGMAAQPMTSMPPMASSAMPMAAEDDIAARLLSSALGAGPGSSFPAPEQPRPAPMPMQAPMPAGMPPQMPPPQMPAQMPQGMQQGMQPGLQSLSSGTLPSAEALTAMLMGQMPNQSLIGQIFGGQMRPPAFDVPQTPSAPPMPQAPSMSWPAQARTPASAQPPIGYSAGPAYDPSSAYAGGAFSKVELDAIRADFPILRQRVNGHPLAWLDNAATTQKPQAVMDALSRFYSCDNSNVHRAAHALAARATDAYEGARKKVQALLKAKSHQEIVFTRGTTESINLVAQAFGGAVLQQGDEVLVAQLEHHANIVPWQMICRARGATLRPIPITDTGEIDINAYARMLGPKTRIVGLAHVSNTLGTVLPIREMTAMAHAVGARVLIDGAQGVSHLPVDVCSIGCDFYVFSGHKLFGPTGVGVLYGRLELLDAMPPWQGGGNMIDRVRFEETTYAPVPAKFEAGTAILAGAVGLGAAIDYIQKIGIERIGAHEHALLHAASDQIAQIPGVRLFGSAPGKVSVASFVMQGVDNERIGNHLNTRGIAVRVGHHCAQPTMDRFGVQGMVRPSFAFYNSFDEVDRLIAALYELRTGQGA